MAFLPSNHPLSRLRDEADIMREIDATADQIAALASSVKMLLVEHEASEIGEYQVPTLLGLIEDLSDGIHGHTDALGARLSGARGATPHLAV